MHPHIEIVPIDSITIGERLREDMGDIASLAESIRVRGLLHPLIVDDNLRLVTGERRLRALRMLDFDEVEVRRWGSLDDEQRREVELEENIRRKDLTDAERSRNLVELVQIKGRNVSDEFVRNPKGGRPPKYGARKETIAEEIGTTEAIIKHAEHHVAAVDTYPFLAQPGWKQYHAMEAAEALDKLSEDERDAVAVIVGDPNIPPPTAIKMVQNMANKPVEERSEIIVLSMSADERERALAKTKLVELPPMPDPRLELLRQAKGVLQKAIKQFPDDPEVPDFQALIDGCDRLVATIRTGIHHGDKAVND